MRRIVALERHILQLVQRDAARNHIESQLVEDRSQLQAKMSEMIRLGRAAMKATTR